MRKLKLQKETLHILTSQQSQGINGGSWFSCLFNCHTHNGGCPTKQNCPPASQATCAATGCSGGGSATCGGGSIDACDTTLQTL
jgi:hypothetical protein